MGGTLIAPPALLSSSIIILILGIILTLGSVAPTSPSPSSREPPAIREPPGMAGLLFVISGPSGVGKGSIIEQLRARLPDLAVSVSATTRPPRPEEQPGVHYHFLQEAEFRAQVEAGAFLEWVEVHGAYYGTPRRQLEERIATGKDLVLDIEVQGAQAVKGVFPDAILIFIAPPSLEELEKRLSDRNTEGSRAVTLRLSRAEEELRLMREYEYIIVNDDLARATDDVAAVITAERRRNRAKKGGNVSS